MATPSRYTVGRQIATVQDVRRELETISTALIGAVRLRGVFTTATAAEMDPLPQPGDLWAEYDPTTGTHMAYLQVETGQQRLRLAFAVNVENA